MYCASAAAMPTLTAPSALKLSQARPLCSDRSSTACGELTAAQSRTVRQAERAPPWPQRRRRSRPVLCTAASASAQPAAGQGRKVIVIGAGAGGLATAGRLARAGLDVTVLEKNAEVGGRLQSATSAEGFRHDTGPSLLLFPDKYREAFEALGTSLEEQGIELRQVQPTAYRVFFEAGPSRPDAPSARGARGSGPSVLDLLADEAAMAQQLEAEEAGAGDGFRRFLRMARRNLSMGVPYFIDRELEDLASPRGLQDLLPLLPELNVLDLLGQHDWRLKQFFRDPRLRAMFTFQDLYVGLDPYTAPAVFGLLAGTELSDGVWYPVGGFQKVRDGLRRAAEACGARIVTGAVVAAIATDPAGASVAGVVLTDGRQLAADVVVCNKDLAAAYSLLDPAGSPSDSAGASATSSMAAAAAHPAASSAPSAAAAEYGRRQHEKLGRLQYSAGVIAYNWSLSRQLSGLAHHNVFLSAEWQQAWRPAATPTDLPAWPNFYVHVPSRTDPSAAPPGCDSVMVLLPVAHMGLMSGSSSSSSSSKGAREPSNGSTAEASPDYTALVEAGRQRILAAFEAAGLGPDVGAAIRQEFVITPPEWERRYGLRYGAAFGLSHGLDQLSLFRPSNKDPRIAGLYFVGASTRPGNGVPLCFISAKLTAQRVLKDLGLQVEGSGSSGQSSKSSSSAVR